MNSLIRSGQKTKTKIASYHEGQYPVCLDAESILFDEKHMIRPMKDSATYKRRESAHRMEAVLIIVSVAGFVASVFVFLSYGWPLGVLAFLLSLVTFALAQLFDLMSELLWRISRVEKSADSNQQAKEKIAS